MASKEIAIRRLRRESSSDNACTLCYHETKVWVVSPCDHSMCLTCACRMRVLCDMKECPVCRESSKKVAVVEKRQPFSSISLSRMIRHRSGFLFENRHLIESFESLKTIHCIKCNDNHEEEGIQRFSNMKHLQDHLRREHHLYMCEICVSHLKLFPHEHKLYTREQLVRHRRDGDPDDSAHKGHPLCQFCDERFLDTETLFFHLKNKHFWCHFCEADGKQDYFADYSKLRGHFREAHYLCSEGQCRYEKFTSVFRTKIDFQAHKAKEHSKGLTKAEAKQLRHVDVGFVYNREDATSNGGMPPVSQRQYGGSGNRKKQGGTTREAEDIEVVKALSLSEQQFKESTSAGSSSEDTSPDPLAHQVKVTPLITSDVQHTKEASTTTTKLPATTKLPERNGWPSLSSSDGKQTDDDDTLTIIPLLAPDPPPPPPPGFTSSKDKLTNKDDKLIKEEPADDIFEIALALLDNNKKKISLFRNCSGLYQRGEISVGDYYQQCSSLFGTSWTSIGLHLAQTLPNPVKRNELYELFATQDSVNNKWSAPPPGLNKPPGLSVPPSRPPPGITPSVPPPSTGKKNKKSKANKSQHTSNKPWGDHKVRPPFKKDTLNDEEFPSLQKASTMPDPVTAPPAWNQKVTVVK